LAKLSEYISSVSIRGAKS